MFEQSDESVDRVRSRIIMVLAGVAVAVLLGALLLFGRFQDTPPEAPPPPPQLENALRAGDPEFEKYTKQVVLLNTEFFTQSNMLGQRQAVIRGVRGATTAGNLGLCGPRVSTERIDFQAGWSRRGARAHSYRSGENRRTVDDPGRLALPVSARMRRPPPAGSRARRAKARPLPW